MRGYRWRILQNCGVSVLTEYSSGRVPKKFQGRRKQFVEVIAAHKPDGSVTSTMIPTLLIFLYGEEYLVEGIAYSGGIKG